MQTEALDTLKQYYTVVYRENQWYLSVRKPLFMSYSKKSLYIWIRINDPDLDKFWGEPSQG